MFLFLLHITHQEDVTHGALKTKRFHFFLIHIGFEFCFILEFTDIPKNWILHFIKSMPTTARNPSTVQSLGFNVQIAF